MYSYCREVTSPAFGFLNLSSRNEESEEPKSSLYLWVPEME